MYKDLFHVRLDVCFELIITEWPIPYNIITHKMDSHFEPSHSFLPSASYVGHVQSLQLIFTIKHTDNLFVNTHAD